jgi:acyl-CoA oxidase
MLSEAKEGNFKLMDVVHHLLSGYKALFSDRTLFAAEICRKACGGAGYSSHSGIPQIFFNASPVPTYEGDNTVMMLQSAKFVKKLSKKGKKGEKLQDPFTYLNNLPRLMALKG